MKLHYCIFLYISIIIIQFGCKSNSNITVYKIKKYTAPNKEEIISQKNNAALLNWVAPNSWIEKPPTDFRIASYNIISEVHQEVIDVSITMFPGDAGGIEQNINRWRRQLNLSPQTIDKIINNAKKQSNMLGDYFIYYLKNKNTKKSIVGAIIPYSEQSSSISQTIFIKMNGSDIVLKELEYEFELFCKSVHWVN